jgi:pimeloyl-ACP methyl ester carboxylesterase
MMLRLPRWFVLFALLTGCPGPEETPDVGALDAPSPGVDAPSPEVDAPELGVDAPSPEVDAPAPGVDAPSTGVDAPVADLDAGPAPSGEPGAPGPYALGAPITDTVVRGSRRTPVRALVPTLPLGETAPLVVFLPGFQLDAAQYALTQERIAGHGFVVVGADPTATFASANHVEMAADAVAVIDWALAAPGLASAIDPARIAMMGHSLGGKVSTMTAARDARVRALVLLDPVNGTAGPFGGYTASAPDIVPEQVAPLAIPMGIFGETLDGTGGFGGTPCAPAAQNYTTFYDAASAGSSPWAAEWTLTGANHMQFLDDRSTCGLTCSFCAMPTASDAVVLTAVRTLSVAFLRRHFRGETAMDAYLTGGSLPAGVTTRHDP